MTHLRALRFCVAAIGLSTSAFAAPPTEAAPPSDGTEESASDGAEVAGSDGAYQGSVTVDPVGFLLFGPALNADLALGRLAVGAGLRWFSPGLTAKALFLTENDEFAFSYGIAGRAHYFFREPLVGPHAGIALEVLRTRVENDGARIAALSTYVIPMLEGGYRLAFRSLLIGGVLGAGYAAEVASRIEDLPGGTNAAFYEVVDESSLYGLVRLDLGVVF